MTIGMVLVVYAYGTFLVLTGKSGDDPEVLLGLAVIVLLILLASSLVFITKKLIPDKRSKTLTGMQTIIRDRLEELNLAMEKLESIRPLLLSRENKVGDVAHETLENATAVLNHMQQEYQATLWKIEILRLLNRYEAVRAPLKTNPSIDFVCAQDHINELDEDCNRLKQHFGDFVNVNSRQQFMADLNNIAFLIDNLRDSAIAGQISRTVQQIHPLRSYQRLEALKPEIDSQIEFAHQFNALSAEFQLLENENIRLKTEQEILKNIPRQ